MEPDAGIPVGCEDALPGAARDPEAAFPGTHSKVFTFGDCYPQKKRRTFFFYREIQGRNITGYCSTDIAGIRQGVYICVRCIRQPVTGIQVHKYGQYEEQGLFHSLVFFTE